MKFVYKIWYEKLRKDFHFLIDFLVKNAEAGK